MSTEGNPGWSKRGEKSHKSTTILDNTLKFQFERQIYSSIWNWNNKMDNIYEKMVLDGTI